jgi:hypothetical protein
MLSSAHIDVMRVALDGLFSTRALEVMIKANIQVDAIWNQFGRHELHFDDNAFEKAYAYLADQRSRIQPALAAERTVDAWRAFGRLTHTAQDFYSHSNYVDLWAARFRDGSLPPADQIDPLDDGLISSPALRSGKPYLPIGILSFVPFLGSVLDRHMPLDSHAHMHLDSVARGPMFEYAFQAGVKRTRAEYDLLRRALPALLLSRFRDL